MSKTIKASDIMTKKVIVATINNKPSQLLTFFTDYKIQHLPVTENDVLIGIVSINDILHFIKDHLQNDATINIQQLDERFNLGDIMTKNPVCIAEDTTLDDLLKILGEGKFQALPVVSEGKLSGIITNKDVVRVYDWEKNHNEGVYSSSSPGFGV
jgi:acetoin utilization protein AcuB